MNQLVLVLDFGGQYKELIARSVRNLNVYSEIKRGNISVEEVKKLNPIGIILTGGPDSVYLENSPKCDKQLFELGIPILGICYGMQLMCYTLGGSVEKGHFSEYGQVEADLLRNGKLFADTKAKSTVLMSHVDCVKDLPKGFVKTAQTQNCPVAAFENVSQKLYGVQFHPEVQHTLEGKQIIKNFLYNVCKAKGDYELTDYLQKQIAEIRKTVGNERVLLGLSGGVDSSVAAAMISKAIDKQLTCVFVDHGFMRYKEGDKIEEVFSKMNLNFIRVNAKDRFLSKLKGVSEPEQKRKIIGAEFANVFQDEAKKLGDIKYLAQGTIYPDVIESGVNGAVIKSHHNVGGLPKNLSFIGLIEPLKGLFKDEVRKLGRQLGLPKALVERQPFPGPGLAIRIMGEITDAKLETLSLADHIVCTEIDKLRKRPNQYFAVLTNVKTVGVMGDDRTYDNVLAIRAVETSDFMTCEYSQLSHKTLKRISTKIVNEVKNINRVVYDITSKPPATVEWE